MRRCGVHRTLPGFAVLALALTACAQTPMGPTVQVLPGPGKSFDAFQADQFRCRQFAEQSVHGQAQNANLRGLGGAALTTALGAGLGTMTSSNAQRSIQDQYNIAFAQCMYSLGNRVPSFGPLISQPR